MIFLAAATAALLGSIITEGGVSIAIVVLGLALGFAIIKGSKEIKANFMGLKVEVGQINRAVNHVDPGEPTLIQQVRDLRSAQDTAHIETQKSREKFGRIVDEKFSLMENRMDRLDQKLSTSSRTLVDEELAAKLDLDGL